MRESQESNNPLGLRPFQLADVDYLAAQRGRLLGHDMGLGKTFMAGELDRRCRQEDLEIRCGVWKPTLVLCPKAVVYTWGVWYAEYCPTERVAVIDPRTADTRKKFKRALIDQTADIYIIHYEGLKLLLEQMHPIRWYHIIADEAHRVSNYRNQTSKAVRALKATWRTALTGTPADRAPDQIWAVLNFLDKATWSSYWNFRKRYVTEYVNHDNKSVTGANPHTVDELQDRLKPVMVRRRKSDVLTELPPKQYKPVWVDLSVTQQRVYNEMRDNMLAWVGEHEDEPLQAAVVIAQLIRLQQIALATPRFETKLVKKKLYCYLESGHEGNCDGTPGATQIPEDWDGVEDPDPGSYWHGRYYDAEQVEIILEDPSSKLDAAMEVIHDLVDAGEQVVVFSQFSKAIELLCTRLDKARISNGKYTGGTRNNTRNKIVSDFAEGTISVFAGTIGAGGTGLNLQTASTMIFLDRAWKPGDNLQAEDRIHRIGQEGSVMIIDIMARRTIDRGRHQHIRRNWHEVQKMLGDTHFDWDYSLDEVAQPAI